MDFVSLSEHDDRLAFFWKSLREHRISFQDSKNPELTVTKLACNARLIPYFLRHGALDISSWLDDDCFIWSDLHVGHSNILKYTPRPFTDVAEMNLHFANSLHALAPSQKVICLGDVFFKNPPHFVFDFMSLWGRVDGSTLMNILHQCSYQPSLSWHEWRPSSWEGETLRDSHQFLHLVGNHDVFVPDWNRVGLESFRFAGVAYALYRDHHLLFSHYPVGDAFLPSGWINVHGHSHDRWISPRHLNVCVEHLGFSPRSFSSIFDHFLLYREKFHLFTPTQAASSFIIP